MTAKAVLSFLVLGSADMYLGKPCGLRVNNMHDSLLVPILRRPYMVCFMGCKPSMEHVRLIPRRRFIHEAQTFPR